MSDLFDDNSSELFNAEVSRIPVENVLPKKLNPGNDKDRMEMFREAGRKAVETLYESDPIVRDALRAQVSLDRVKGVRDQKSSLVITDDRGDVIGLTKPVLTGVHATGKNQLDLMRKIKAGIYKHYSIND